MTRADQVLAATYARRAAVLVRGQGCTLWDAAGRPYLDFVAGIAVCNLGHAHPRVTAALAHQAATLVHVSNLYYTQPQTLLAEWLTARCFADRVFFCNSGAEANEAAIKLARRFFNIRGQAQRHRIVSMQRSFHGRTFATLSATGQEKVRLGYDPILAGFDFVPFGDIEALARAVGPDTCAIILEPIQGEGGVQVPPPGYLPAVRRLCDQTGTLLIFDEIQTGIGRTGSLFAHQQMGASPDIMTLAKALANGLPAGAMLAREEVAAAFSPGSHASTFGGTPLVAAAALATLETLEQEGLIERCRANGDYLRRSLETLRTDDSLIRDVRGMGLLVGMELACEGEPLVRACQERGVLINCVQGNVLRFIPPLIVSEPEIDALVACLRQVLPATAGLSAGRVDTGESRS
jgi:acetylornithine aminotransferase